MKTARFHLEEPVKQQEGVQIMQFQAYLNNVGPNHRSTPRCVRYAEIGRLR